MSQRRRIGVFGGAFDPPHIGHRIVAQDVHDRLDLERLIVVPTFRPPHRDTTFPGKLRLELARLAFADADGIEVSDIEFERGGVSYMVDTLEHIGRQADSADLWLVIGSDQYAAFETWHQPDRILELAHLAVMKRGDDMIEVDQRFPFQVVDVTRIDVSGERIRRRLSKGQSVRYLVPESVNRAIETEKEHVTG